MKVARDTVVSFHYELSEEGGQAQESSRGGDAVAALVGHGALIPGVETALEGREAGERFQVTVAPEQGYGRRRDGWTQRVSKKHLIGTRKPKVGDTVMLRTRDGGRRVTVTKVGSSVVDVDLNHPMAGRTLLFQIEIVDVRAAEPVELAHGHVHRGTHAH